MTKSKPKKDVKRTIKGSRWGTVEARRKLSSRLCAFFKSAKVSPTQFAAAIGGTERLVHFYVSGRYYPMPERLKQIDAIIARGCLPWQQPAKKAAKKKGAA